MNQNTSLFFILLDRSFGDLIRMIKAGRLEKSERGPLSWDFVITLTILMIFGLIMLFSASYTSGYYNYSGDVYHFIRAQTKYAIVGFVVMFAISALNYRALHYLTSILYAVTLFLLAVVLIMPTDVDGFHRWFSLGGVSFQPSEIAKFTAILWIADQANLRYERRGTLVDGIGWTTLPLLPLLGLLLLEPHKSATLLILLIIGVMLLCGGCGGLWVIPAGSTGIAVMWYYLMSKQDYTQERLGGVWGLTPSDTANMGWQTKQGLYAISSGGLFGLGIGNSRQKHQWLPYAENDFIFSIVCEELGFLGAVALIVLFGFLIVQGIRISLNAPDYFGSMLGIGVTAQIALQVFCHIGVNTALMPNTGISLPFFSSGGTSLLMLLAEMGVLLSISRAGNARIQAEKRQKQAELSRRMNRGGTRTIYRRTVN